MNALQKLIIAGVAAALVSAPAVALERVGRPAADPQLTAQDTCRAADACETAAAPEFCIADHVCAVALPPSALIRYDALMDAAAAR